MWLAWAVIILGFQALVDARYQPVRPDHVLDWTADYTGPGQQAHIPYLGHPFMNHQVSWDSEFYLSIANGGYDDPASEFVETENGQRVSLNYNFLPAYPYTVHVVGAPLRALGVRATNTYTLAGVLIALAGTLAGLIALYDIARAQLDENGVQRVVFYALIFPTSFFYAQVYSEGLFIGLAFTTLALARRKHLAMAALLAALATWTRTVGVVLIVPLGMAWLDRAGIDWRDSSIRHLPLDRLRRLTPQMWLLGIWLLAPVGAYLVWRYFFGEEFEIVNTLEFVRKPFVIEQSFRAWGSAFLRLTGVWQAPAQTRTYFLLEFGAVGLGFWGSIITLRRYPDIALFSLLSWLIVITSGSAVSASRYTLAMPAVFIALGLAGQRPLFDRIWTLISVLLLALLTSLFTFDMWVA
jgi:hypothetical protein